MSNRMNGTALAALAARLATTLEQEFEALGSLRDDLREMIQALRTSNPDALSAGASSLQGQIHAAAELRQAQRRQVSLISRSAGLPEESLNGILAELARHPEAAAIRGSLHTTVTQVRHLAQETGQLVAALEYAIRFASQVNQEMVRMLHGLLQPDGGRVYTSRGTTTAPRNRKTLLNRVG